MPGTLPPPPSPEISAAIDLSHSFGPGVLNRIAIDGVSDMLLGKLVLPESRCLSGEHVNSQ